MMVLYQCTNCRRPYPAEGAPHRCLTCGGVFGINGDLPYDPKKIDGAAQGIWRYRHAFGLPDDAPVVTLGEGETPLVEAEAFEQPVHFKLEYLNPTGSFKDRITAPEMSFLLSRGVAQAVEDSSGNAGASFAAYAARAGVRARVFVPDYASGPKRAQIEAYGAELVPVSGPRSNAAEAVLAEVEAGRGVYASHAYQPFGLAGLATIAYELYEQLGQAPGTVFAPVGQGSLLLGIGLGFAALKGAGIIAQLPKLIGVQAAACAPLWALHTLGPTGLLAVHEGETLAEGVRIRRPVHGDAVLKMVQETGGTFLAVDEENIQAGVVDLASLGFYVEPTSAIVWDALLPAALTEPDPVVAILTGSGLKSN